MEAVPVEDSLIGIFSGEECKQNVWYRRIYRP